jgi:hypothetical protein
LASPEEVEAAAMPIGTAGSSHFWVVFLFASRPQTQPSSVAAAAARAVPLSFRRM